MSWASSVSASFVVSLSLLRRPKCSTLIPFSALRGGSSSVERLLAKEKVASPILVRRSKELASKT